MGLIFKHSGRLGDIVYSLPLIKKMADKSGEPADLFVPSDVPSRLGGNVYHPGGEVMVGDTLFRFIEPLLAVQPYLRKVEFVKTNQLPSEFIDLDKFKSSGLNLKAGIIQGWYRKAFGVAFPLDQPWLSLPAGEVTDKNTEFDVLISRTTRFCNTSINYGFLDSIQRTGFIGLDYEYQEFTRRYGLNSIKRIVISDALQLAKYMHRTQVYVGNQSVNFAIADGFKITRALEAFEPVPVASPVGGYCTEYTCSSALADFISEVIGQRLTAGPDLPGEYCDSIKPQDGWRPPLRDRLRQFLRR